MIVYATNQKFYLEMFKTSYYQEGLKNLFVFVQVCMKFLSWNPIKLLIKILTQFLIWPKCLQKRQLIGKSLWNFYDSVRRLVNWNSKLEFTA